MEDKQVYSTARSAELKKQIEKYQKDFSQWLEKRRSQKKDTPIAQKLFIRNTALSQVEPKPDSYETPVKQASVKRVKRQEEHSNKVFFSNNAKNLITYSLFGFIVFFILLGIYLTYRK